MGSCIATMAGEVVRKASSEPVICKLSKGSTEDLVAIELESNRPPWSKKLFASEFENEYATVFGARLAGELIGFLVAHIAADECHIVNLGIRADSRGQGVGRALLVGVLRELHEQAVRWVSLEVRKGNKVAQGLYESVGFSENGQRASYYSDDGEDALVMNLSIYDFIDNFGQ